MKKMGSELNKTINFMEQSPSSEADGCSFGKDIPCLLWNPKVQYHVRKGLQLDPIVSQFIVVLMICCLGHTQQ
jgi:hypothetical protein